MNEWVNESDNDVRGKHWKSWGKKGKLRSHMVNNFMSAAVFSLSAVAVMMNQGL